VFGTGTDHVHGPCTAVYTVCTQPRAAVHSLHTAAHGRVQTVYMAVHGPCTWSVHERVHSTRPCLRPCLRPVCTAVYVPCIWPCTRPFTDRVHRRATAVYMVRPRCVRPCRCTLYTYTVGYSVHGLVYGPCTRPLTAVYRLCTRPCTGHVHGQSVTRSRPCMRPVHGRVPSTRPSLRPVCTALYVPCTRPFTACTNRVHRRARAVYMVRPRLCTGYTYTVGYSVHGLVYSPCIRPLTTVYRLCTRPCTGHVHGPSVTDHGRVREPEKAVYREHGRLYGPCAGHCTYRQPSSCSVNQ